MGFEPTTFSLARRRSTAEPRPHNPAVCLAESAESQNRTGDTAIFSRVLYQLSYLGLNVHTLFPEHAYCTYMLGDCQAKYYMAKSSISIQAG